jgi:hypothetical protein
VTTTPQRVRLVTYATRPFRKAQQRNIASAKHVGGFERIFAHSRNDIDRLFRAENRRLLRAERGAGYWLWKPYFVNRHLLELRDTEWLFYCDAGARFVTPVTPLIEHAREHCLEVLVFELEPHHVEREWTKRDAFILLDGDTVEIQESPQRLASYSLWRGTDAARELADAWLRYACDPRILSDIPNTCGLPNHDGFRDHRHDQSILSVLTKVRRIPAWRDPSQYGNAYRGAHSSCLYPQIVELTRDRASTLRTRIASAERRLRRR